MSSVDVPARLAIHDLLCRFFAAFDERDWDAMVEALEPEIFVDYSSSGREQPRRMPAAEFVERRRGAVDDLVKQHGFSNLLLTDEPDGPKGRCHYLILRFARGPVEGEGFYHSCGSYEFKFAGAGDRFRIAAIRQMTLRSWGDRELHTGSRQPA